MTVISGPIDVPAEDRISSSAVLLAAHRRPSTALQRRLRNTLPVWRAGDFRAGERQVVDKPIEEARNPEIGDENNRNNRQSEYD